MEFIKNPNVDFMGKVRYFVAGSVLFIVAGIALMSSSGLLYGVEFSGGTQLVVQFSGPPAIDRIRDAVQPAAPGAVIQTFDDPAKNQVLIRVADQELEEGQEIDAPAQATLKALAESYADNAIVSTSTEIVGPIVGAELRRKAVQITVLGLFFQLLYIGFRFKGLAWGAAASVAVFHDVLITLTLLTVFGYEVTLNVIAALLTLVGYSVNDTIVIFDRARENLRQRRKIELRGLLNMAINQTLSRTLITSGTTFLAMLALYLFGGEVLRGFAFTMVVGVIVGTYSTIYIAVPIVISWQQGKGRQAHTA